MLSPSPAKIHEPRVTGVSPRPTDRRQRQKLRNTRVGSNPNYQKHEGLIPSNEASEALNRRSDPPYGLES